MNFSYEEESESFSINDITVYAPAADKEMIMTTFAPQSQVGEINISANFGIDMDTEKHTTISSIANNPNAIKILDIAINDLSQAEILGECRLAVPIGSDRIPCSNSTNRPKNKRKNI